MKPNPCWECPDRKMHCAIGCEAYAAYRKGREEIYKGRENTERLIDMEKRAVRKKRNGQWRRRKP